MLNQLGIADKEVREYEVGVKPETVNGDKVNPVFTAPAYEFGVPVAIGLTEILKLEEVTE